MTDSQVPAILGGPPVRSSGPPPWPPDRPEVLAAIQAAWADGSWGWYEGPAQARLCQALAELCGVALVELCASGTAAIELALRGLKLGPQDEVVLAAYDFKGNFVNVLTVGAVPVLADVHSANWNLDPEALEAAIGPRTKAIIATHLHGGVVPMSRVMAIAQSHGLAVIEDACQMPGAWIDGKRAGTWGNIGILSFGGSKLLSAGRGGAILSNEPELIQRIRLYHQRGNLAYPLSEIQAVVLVPQVDRLKADQGRRSENVALLAQELEGLPGLRLFSNSADDSSPDYYKLGMQYDPAGFDGLDRDGFAAAVRAEGIALDPGFRALHCIHSRRRYRSAGDLPEATRADRGSLVLHHPVLLAETPDVLQVAQAIRKVAAHAEPIRHHLAGNGLSS